MQVWVKFIRTKLSKYASLILVKIVPYKLFAKKVLDTNITLQGSLLSSSKLHLLRALKGQFRYKHLHLCTADFYFSPAYAII